MPSDLQDMDTAPVPEVGTEQETPVTPALPAKARVFVPAAKKQIAAGLAGVSVGQRVTLRVEGVVEGHSDNTNEPPPTEDYLLDSYGIELILLPESLSVEGVAGEEKTAMPTLGDAVDEAEVFV